MKKLYKWQTCILKVAGKAVVTLWKPAFHKNATINGDNIKTLFDECDETGKTNTKGRVDVLDVVNDIAVIRITMEDYAGANYVDFHVLKKEEDGWQIIAKVFTDLI